MGPLALSALVEGWPGLASGSNALIGNGSVVCSLMLSLKPQGSG